MTAKTVKLMRPVEAHGETQTSITLREPTADDIRKCGYIVSSFLNAEYPGVEEVRVNADAAAFMVERKAGYGWQQPKRTHGVIYGSFPISNKYWR